MCVGVAGGLGRGEKEKLILTNTLPPSHTSQTLGFPFSHFSKLALVSNFKDLICAKNKRIALT